MKLGKCAQGLQQADLHSTQLACCHDWDVDTDSATSQDGNSTLIIHMLPACHT